MVGAEGGEYDLAVAGVQKIQGFGLKASSRCSCQNPVGSYFEDTEMKTVLDWSW